MPEHCYFFTKRFVKHSISGRQLFHSFTFLVVSLSRVVLLPSLFFLSRSLYLSPVDWCPGFRFNWYFCWAFLQTVKQQSLTPQIRYLFIILHTVVHTAGNPISLGNWRGGLAIQLGLIGAFRGNLQPILATAASWHPWTPSSSLREIPRFARVLLVSQTSCNSLVMKLLHYAVQQWKCIHGDAAEQRGQREVAEANSARPFAQRPGHSPGYRAVVSGSRPPRETFTPTRTQWTLFLETWLIKERHSRHMC